MYIFSFFVYPFFAAKGNRYEETVLEKMMGTTYISRKLNIATPVLMRIPLVLRDLVHILCQTEKAHFAKIRTNSDKKSYHFLKKHATIKMQNSTKSNKKGA